MRKALAFAALTVALLGVGVGPVPPARVAPAAAWYEEGIGNGDTLVVLTPWETAVFYARLTRHTYPGPQCGLPGAGRVNKVWKHLNRACGARKATAAVQYARVKWFLQLAKAWGACGAYVVHRNARGELSIRPARGWDGDSYSPVVKVSPGKTTSFQTSLGYTNVTCTEYANPSLQSPLSRPVAPSRPRPPVTQPYSGGGSGEFL